VLTVVIPTLNAGSTLGACLEALERSSEVLSGIIVVDGGSADDTIDVARSFGVTVVTNDRGTSLQRNRGLGLVVSRYVLFVDADMVVPPKPIFEGLWILERASRVTAVVLPEISTGRGYWARVRWLERSCYVDCWWMQAARLFRTDAIRTIGGFDASLYAGEDWDVDQRIRQLGFVAQTPSSLYHWEGQPTLRSLLDKKEGYTGSLPAYRQKWPQRASLQLSPLARANVLFQHSTLLMQHPLLSTGLGILGVGEFLKLRRSADAPLRNQTRVHSDNQRS
jgi:glycosyltransferase involved in cell wall biosynthesis